MRLLLVPFALAGLALVALLGLGFILDPPETDRLPAGDAVVVISGDEQLARFREGLRLYNAGLGKYLVLSGAARDAGISNAQAMSDMAVSAGVPRSAIIEDSFGEDTWGNAVYTRRLLEQRGLHSAILVTSPYHARRALMTFDAAYEGSSIQITIHSAPDSEWRKLSWWQQPDTRRLTASELQKLAYILITGKYH